ncbi:hypothetical protein CMQ_732 [Grosmannia clavigera kw1407]|uniref:F-box domain containing protein n=1 Tax=Grosmannia clavigera (strain kw1407 / UAMH 11150) TaxID=655863 RepID=F0XDT4_GROCL|nr:uncharacterized protein CMQ_732 [Grosmannia clavigera kw1407]EFX03804.1 hypothetical protein CMQ_732 [Grosmannia clavigera kw1407]
MSHETYSFFAPRLHERDPQASNHRFTLTTGTGSRLIRLLAVPVMPHAEKRQVDAPVPTSLASHDLSTISRLPYELHCLVFSHLDDVADIVCLGLVNQYFWQIGRQYMHKHYMGFFGRWAHTNIICTSQNLDPSEYPDMFPEAEIKRLLERPSHDYSQAYHNASFPEVPYYPAKQMYKPDGTQIIMCSGHTGDTDDEDDGFDTDEELPFEFRESLRCGLKRDRDISFLRYKAQHLIERLRGRGLESDCAFVRMQSELLISEELYFPQDQPWILRNWTAKQIVRSDAIALAPWLIHGPCTHAIGLGEAVLTRICWVSASRLAVLDDSKKADKLERQLARGAWAGHRFDIVLRAQHEQQTGGVGWSDVSEEVAKEDAEVWKVVYGSDWRTKLRDWQAEAQFSDDENWDSKGGPSPECGNCRFYG